MRHQRFEMSFSVWHHSLLQRHFIFCSSLRLCCPLLFLSVSVCLYCVYSVLCCVHKLTVKLMGAGSQKTDLDLKVWFDWDRLTVCSDPRTCPSVSEQASEPLLCNQCMTIPESWLAVLLSVHPGQFLPAAGNLSVPASTLQLAKLWCPTLEKEPIAPETTWVVQTRCLWCHHRDEMDRNDEGSCVCSRGYFLFSVVLGLTGFLKTPARF